MKMYTQEEVDRIIKKTIITAQRDLLIYYYSTIMIFDKDYVLDSMEADWDFLDEETAVIATEELIKQI